jgi:hypothetical protein
MSPFPGCWRPLNGLCKLIGMEFYPMKMPAPKFATEPFFMICPVNLCGRALRWTVRGLPDNAVLKVQDSNVPLPHMQEFRKLHLIGTESPSKSIKGSSFLISVRAAATGKALRQPPDQ